MQMLLRRCRCRERQHPRLLAAVASTQLVPAEVELGERHALAVQHDIRERHGADVREPIARDVESLKLVRGAQRRRERAHLGVRQTIVAQVEHRHRPQQ